MFCCEAAGHVSAFVVDISVLIFARDVLCVCWVCVPNVLGGRRLRGRHGKRSPAPASRICSTCWLSVIRGIVDARACDWYWRRYHFDGTIICGRECDRTVHVDSVHRSSVTAATTKRSDGPPHGLGCRFTTPRKSVLFRFVYTNKCNFKIRVSIGIYWTVGHKGCE